MQSIFSVFQKYDDARKAVEYMLAEIVKESDINAIAQDWVAKSNIETDLNAINVAVSEFPPGLDRMLGGKQPMVLPDTGSVHVAGDRATLLVKSATDSESGLKETLQDFGLSPDTAKEIAEAVRNGGVLLWAAVEDTKAAAAGDIFKLHNGRFITAASR